MICVRISDTLYPGGTFGANSCIVCVDFPFTYAPVVKLHSTRIVLTAIMLTGLSDAYHLFGYNTRDGEKPNNDPILFGLSKLTRYAHLISLLMVLSLPRSERMHSLPPPSRPTLSFFSSYSLYRYSLSLSLSFFFLDLSPGRHRRL